MAGLGAPPQDTAEGRSGAMGPRGREPLLRMGRLMCQKFSRAIFIVIIITCTFSLEGVLLAKH